MSDPLDTVVSDVDLSYPMIPPGIYEFKVTKTEKKPTKKGGQMIVLTLVATKPIQSIKGDMVTNFTLTFNLVITPTEKLQPVDIGKNVARVAQALEIRDKTARQIINAPEQLVGRVGNCKTQNSQERTDAETGQIYEPRSEIHSFVVKK